MSWQRCVCCDKSKLVVTKPLSQQNYVGRDKDLSWQKFCHDKNMFVMTKVLLQQAYFCRDKSCVLSRQTRVCCDKHVFVVTKLLLFVTTKIILVAAPANDRGDDTSDKMNATLFSTTDHQTTRSRETTQAHHQTNTSNKCTDFSFACICFHTSVHCTHGFHRWVKPKHLEHENRYWHNHANMKLQASQFLHHVSWCNRTMRGTNCLPYLTLPTGLCVLVLGGGSWILINMSSHLFTIGPILWICHHSGPILMMYVTTYWHSNGLIYWKQNSSSWIQRYQDSAVPTAH